MYSEQQKALLKRNTVGVIQDDRIQRESVSLLMGLYDGIRKAEYEVAVGSWTKAKSIERELDFWLGTEDREEVEPEELEEVCGLCFGTGEVTFGAFDDLVTKKCLCQKRDDEREQD